MPGRAPFVAALCLAVAAPAHALTCETLSAEIDQKIRATGMTGFALTTIDAAASAPGKTVGNCDNGSRRIVYTVGVRGAGMAASVPRATAARRAEPVLTECKPGFSGPDCRPD